MSFLYSLLSGGFGKEMRKSSIGWFNENRANLRSSVQAHLNFWARGVEDHDATLLVQTTFIYALANLPSLMRSENTQPATKVHVARKRVAWSPRVHRQQFFSLLGDCK